jgi:cell division protein FtsI (penicillin-binding protein 3)
VIRPERLTVVHACFVLFAAAIGARAGYVQVVQAPTWRDKAATQQVTAQELPAPRGTILDAGGTVLVESRPLVQFAVAPRELRADQRERLAQGLRDAGVPEATVAKALDTTRKWVPVPGRFLAAEVASVTALRGVHTETVLERVPPPLVGLRGLVGHASPAGQGLDGLELALDSLLRGTPGRLAMVRDGHRSRLQSPALDRVPPQPGHSIVLSLRLGLQDIAERALADAVASAGASGGDVVVLDPRSGEVLALASRRRDPSATTATALTEPVEPGSTLKPFIAAALLERGRVPLQEVFPTYDGVFKVAGRTIRDVHKASEMSFADVIRHSSNIGMVLAAERLTPQEHFEALRDFGFGLPTGVQFPSEAAGMFRAPARWSKQSKASLSMGYEITVTPLQLAAAYGALANGGLLLQPTLVKEIRAADGTVLHRHAPRPVRRVVSEATAAEMRRLLRAVVDSGTATRANLTTYEVGGKSGTARRTVGGRYAQGSYTANFVGLFPAEDPQLVVLVKLDAPTGTYYGGQVAAPVMKAVLEAALASSDAALDHGRLTRKPRAPEPPQLAARRDSVRNEVVEAAGELAVDGSVPVVLTLDAAPAARETAHVVVARPVPSVAGLPLRRAVHELHRAGFKVRVVDGGREGETAPAAGALRPAGALIALHRGA